MATRRSQFCRQRPALTTVFLGLFLLTVAPWAQGEELTAVVTQVEGTVTVEGGRAHDEVRRLRPPELVRAGDKINVPDGGRVGLVCSTDHWIELSGPKRWTVTEPGCDQGCERSPGTYRSLAPRGGRFRVVDGMFVLERSVREPVPDALLLSPRQTAVLEARPVIRWRQVARAVEYEIELNSLVQRVDASKLRCEADPAWDDVAVCSFSLPADHPGLPAGKISFLNVGYRTSIAARVARKEEESLPIERLSEEKAQAVRERLAAIASLPVSESIRGLLEAGVYAEHGLWADAIAAYRRSLALLPEAPTQVTLGDLYLKIGLHRFAFARYQEALDRYDDLTVDAAATFGIGRLYAARRVYGEALCHFRKAEGLYERLGLDEEKAAATQAAAEAEARQLKRSD